MDKYQQRQELILLSYTQTLSFRYRVLGMDTQYRDSRQQQHNVTWGCPWGGAHTFPVGGGGTSWPHKHHNFHPRESFGVEFHLTYMALRENLPRVNWSESRCSRVVLSRRTSSSADCHDQTRPPKWISLITYTTTLKQRINLFIQISHLSCSDDLIIRDAKCQRVPR